MRRQLEPDGSSCVWCGSNFDWGCVEGWPAVGMFFYSRAKRLWCAGDKDVSIAWTDTRFQVIFPSLACSVLKFERSKLSVSFFRVKTPGNQWNSRRCEVRDCALETKNRAKIGCCCAKSRTQRCSANCLFLKSHNRLNRERRRPACCIIIWNEQSLLPSLSMSVPRKT